MRVVINLICKTIKDNIVQVLSSNNSNDLISFELKDKENIDLQINTNLKSYNIQSQWIDIQLSEVVLIEGVLNIFYSTWIAEQFIDKESKFLDIKSISSTEIVTAIIKSLQIKPI